MRVLLLKGLRPGQQLFESGSNPLHCIFTYPAQAGLLYHSRADEVSVVKIGVPKQAASPITIGAASENEGISSTSAACI